MTAEEVFKKSEDAALRGKQIIAHVEGKSMRSTRKKKAGFSAMGFLVAIIAVIGVLFSSGNLIPAAISERLIEETDVQYADAVESKALVFQQALKEGDVPNDTAERLEANGVEVGHIENVGFVKGSASRGEVATLDDGVFVREDKSAGELVLKMGDKIITADEFYEAVNNDINLYEAFTDATYGRAAYYFDKEADRVFKEIGTTRNNYNSDASFDEVMTKVMGSGSNIDVNNVAVTEEKDGDKIKYKYSSTGDNIKSNTNAASFIEAVRNKNYASSTAEATLNTADSLKVADTMSKEQRSSLFFLTFMENISKMKAGEGNESKIHEAMDFLHTSAETEIVDTATGEVIKVNGTPLDAPSLYAILSGNKIDVDLVANYSSDRVLNTVENRVGNSGISVISNTIASLGAKLKGSIGRLVGGSEMGSSEILKSVEPTIQKSLVDNSFDNLKGVEAGEFLVEGAVNTGKLLAKASGGTAGDAGAVAKYARLHSTILAMDAKLDRKNRSPFDITSKNTFLGMIFDNVVKFGILNNSGRFFGIETLAGLINNSVSKLILGVYADAAEGYLSNFGKCKTYATIGAVGSAGCSEIATFDTSTLDDPFNDPGFIKFVEDNTTLVDGVRTVNNNSILRDFMSYNNLRKTPLGTVDGGILASLTSDTSEIPVVSDILSMVENSVGITEDNKKIATGAAFVNSENNPDWQKYKYAQRYVSLARAAATLKQYSNNETAYNNILYFEGERSPVARFLDSFDTSDNDLVVAEISN